MADVLLDSFVGYKPDVASPVPNSARSTKNASIHLHRQENKPGGWIELAQGYAKKFSALPANDAVIRKITNITFDKPYDLWIPEHGGQTVTILTGTYRKTAFFPAAPHVDRSGVWIRPYWSGAAWIDAWIELTEMFIFELVSLGVGAGEGNKLYIDDGSKYDFKTVDPTGIVFKTDYFKNWTIVYDAFGNAENYDLVGGSDYTGNNYHIETVPYHLNTQFTTRVAGTKLILYKAFLLEELPSALSSHIYGLLSQARITTGNNATDVVLGVGHKAVTFEASGYAYTKTVDALIADQATPEVWQYAGVVGWSNAGDVGTDPLKAGTYYMRYSIVMDDGNETRLWPCVKVGGWDGPTDWLADTNVFTFAIDQMIQLRIYRSQGSLPWKAKTLRFYLSDDDITYYQVKDFDLRSTTIWETCRPFGAVVLGGNHWYALGGLTYPTTRIWVTATDWKNAGDSPETQRGGMSRIDTGVIQFKHGAVVGRSTFAVGVRALGKLYPNFVFTTTSNGDGQPTFDTFALLPELMVDLEYNDGDELVAIGPLTDRALAMKASSIVLISLTNGIYTRDIVTAADGICSAETLAVFDDVVYWAGYAGIYEYSTRGWQLINKAWWDEWIAVSPANKQASIGVIDRLNRQYRLAYAGIERVLDLDTGEWMCADLADQPSAFTRNTRLGQVDFLSGSLIQTLGAGTRHDGADFTADYETNDFDAAPAPGQNALFQAVQLLYNSSVSLSVQLYADGVASGGAIVLPASATDTYALVDAPLSCRAKKFRLKISATTTAASQTVQIKQVKPVYDITDAGVSNIN